VQYGLDVVAVGVEHEKARTREVLDRDRQMVDELASCDIAHGDRSG
jgi:predicted RNA-binding protein